MSYIFNKEKLNKLLLDFYNSTNIATTLYDSNMNVIATSPTYTPYCLQIRSNNKCVLHCDKSNYVHMQKAKSSKSTVIYTCHAGLVETITPIYYEKFLIAYIQIGQFRNKESLSVSTKEIEKIANTYNYDKNNLINLYKKVTQISSNKLNSLNNIINILVKSFWEDGLIKQNRSMLSIKIEEYISKHLSEKIYIHDICDKFYISKNSLYRLFHKEFNLTINEYILQQRLILSKQYLENNSCISITQVSEMCGFTDYNYFIRQFKKMFNITPLKYKKQFIYS